MVSLTIYLFVAMLGAGCSIYTGGRVIVTGLRTGRMRGAGKSYERVASPGAYYGIIIGWLVINTILILSAAALLSIYIEKLA